jgi:hypothetical protein
MTLSFEITEQEYREAAAVLRRQRRKDWYRPIRAAAVVGGGIGVAMALAGGWAMLPPVLPLLLLSLFVLAFPVLQTRDALKVGWDAYQSTARRMTWQFADHSATVQTDGVTTSYEWRVFRRFAETRHLFLLYRTADQPFLIPKRTLGDAAAVEAFRQFLQAKVPGPALGFPVSVTAK